MSKLKERRRARRAIEIKIEKEAQQWWLGFNKEQKRALRIKHLGIERALLKEEVVKLYKKLHGISIRGGKRKKAGRTKSENKRLKLTFTVEKQLIEKMGGEQQLKDFITNAIDLRLRTKGSDLLMSLLKEQNQND